MSYFEGFVLDFDSAFRLGNLHVSVIPKIDLKNLWVCDNDFFSFHHVQKAVVSLILVKCEPNMSYFKAEVLMYDSIFSLYNLYVSKILKNNSVYSTSISCIKAN